MEDQVPDPKSPSHGSERTEPVRSRWTPKPEQILILESIFNSGMVNPPKEETVRIRKLLEKFGTVGDANVFYWFQNRRSRSRRQQRQMQAGLVGDSRNTIRPPVGGAIQFETTSSGACFNSTITTTTSSSLAPSPSACLVGSSSCRGFGDDSVDDLFSFPHQMGLPEINHCANVSSVLCPLDSSNLHFHSGFITVFINGVVREVPRGPFDMKAMFGEEVMLLHSSGLPVPVNEYGFSLQSLQLGESYFLVSRPT